MMSQSVVVNEVLCYVQNNLGNHAHVLIRTAINGFFTDDEVSTAKLCMYSTLEEMQLEGLPRLIRRQPGESKRKLECDDIINMFVFADGQATLPTFVAAKLDRVPSVAPGDVDIYALAANVASMTVKLDSLMKHMDNVPKMSDLENVQRRLDVLEAGNFPPLAANSAAVPMSLASLPSTSWVSTAAAGGQGNLNVRKPPVIRVRGSSSTTSVKGVPRAPPTPIPKVSAFVGRIDKKTTAEELQSLLEAAGVKVIRCRKLVPKSELWTTAAFYVACEEESKDIFYDEATWPEGAELRDWYYKS